MLQLSTSVNSPSLDVSYYSGIKEQRLTQEEKEELIILLLNPEELTKEEKQTLEEFQSKLGDNFSKFQRTVFDLYNKAKQKLITSEIGQAPEVVEAEFLPTNATREEIELLRAETVAKAIKTGTFRGII